MRESIFQSQLIKELKERFPGCVVLKNDANYIQGIPDLIVLFNNCWAMLEVKASHRANLQPNQQYYVEMFNDMSFAAVIYPENKEEVLNALYDAFQSCGSSRCTFS